MYIPRAKEKMMSTQPEENCVIIFSRGNAPKNTLTITKERWFTPLMVETKEIRVKISPGAHHVYLQCAKEQGYKTVSEFVRRAIQEKIAKECYHLIMTVEEIDAETKKAPE
jgi:hypothetical protein